ncbi:MAG: hypothetical protein KAS15_04445, partial [Nanoarchaeota archaeon]|nr:hypothetical protein [Nanoarchaeota archaeon]
FYVNDTTNPLVFDLIPTADSHFNVSDIIEIAANVSDFLIANVSATITYPNGTNELMQLSNAVGDKYNSSFTAPFLLGRYNVSFTANDTSNNINDTEETYFYVRGNTSLFGYGYAPSDFSFASSDYVISEHKFFNTSRPDTNFTLFTSMNIKKLTGEGASDVWIRFKVDNVEILEEKLRTVETIGDEGSTGTKPITFNVSSGEHNFTIEFKRTGNGSIDVNDFDLAVLKFITTLENTVRVQLTTDSYNHSSPSFVPAFNWTITKSYVAPTYFLIKQTVQGDASSATVDYYFEDLDTNVISSFWRRYLSSPSDVGSVSGVNIEGADIGEGNHTIQSKTSAGTVTVDFSLIEFDLNDNELNLINSFQVSNPLTNLTASKNYSEGLHNLANKTVTIQNGTQYFLAMTSSFATTTGNQTPTYFINSSEVPESSCYSKRERYLSSDSDVGNAFIYMVCKNLTVGNTYTFNLWLNVSSGENVSQFDESFNGFEITGFDTTSINLAPIPNEITNPAQGDHEGGIINITWLAFSDPNGDPVTYNVSLFNSDDTFNQTINTSTGLTYQSFNSTTVPDGDWMIYVEGCDDGSLCSNSSTNFTIDNIAPTINISVNDTDVEYGVESVLIDFNVSNVDLDSVIANVTYPNSTLLQQLTNQSVDFIFVPANLTALGRYNITVFANDTSGNTNTTASFFYVNDTSPPTWDQTPINQIIQYNNPFSYDVNASDNYQIDKYFINDTNNFAINSSTGVITNATSLIPGILYLNISVNDTSGNTNSTPIQITV